jgi:parallel beta-helix repeat protein
MSPKVPIPVPTSWFRTTTLGLAELTIVSFLILTPHKIAQNSPSVTVQEWADGISLSCKDSTVTNNVITGATDGGIVIFGSPGSHIYNNISKNLSPFLVTRLTLNFAVRASDNMQLGGINLVDYAPWSGNFNGTVVENNQIFGGFATSALNSTTDEGKNAEDTFIKIGIAMGSRTWFGSKFGYDMNYGAVVRNNSFHGAVSAPVYALIRL